MSGLQFSLSLLDWRKVTKEEDTTPNMMDIYAKSKTIAELSAWEFADAHPELDLSTRKTVLFTTCSFT